MTERLGQLSERQGLTLAGPLSALSSVDYRFGILTFDFYTRMYWSVLMMKIYLRTKYVLYILVTTFLYFRESKASCLDVRNKFRKRKAIHL